MKAKHICKSKDKELVLSRDVNGIVAEHFQAIWISLARLRSTHTLECCLFHYFVLFLTKTSIKGKTKVKANIWQVK